MDFLSTLHLVIRSTSAFLGIIGNGFVILLITKFESLRTKQNAFILSLAVSDFLYCFAVSPVRSLLDNIYHTNMSNNSYQQWFTGCQTLTVINVMSYYGDYLSIAAITLDRFLYIKFPFKYTEKMTARRAGYAIAGIIIVSFSLSILFVFGSNDYERGETCSAGAFVQAEYFAGFDVPLLALTCTAMFFTFYIYHNMVKKTYPEVNASAGSKSQNKVTRMMLTVVTIFLVSNVFWYTVYFITDGMEDFGIRLLQNFSSWLWLVSQRNYYTILHHAHLKKFQLQIRMGQVLVTGGGGYLPIFMDNFNA